MNAPPDRDGGHLPIGIAAEMQDHLMAAINDLERLLTLLTDACETLTHRFHGASGHIHSLMKDPAFEASLPESKEVFQHLIQHLGGAVTALQFEDMANQLIVHTHLRLRNCSDTLANEAFGQDDDGSAVITPAPLRPNPVTQSEMDAGSVELF